MSVTFTKQGRIGIATVDNPPVNALGHAVRTGLAAAVAQADADPEVKALILICAGRTFLAGADIKEFGRPLEPPLLNDLVNDLEASTKPFVAAIHGTALGGGLEVALACHFRIAVPSARLGLPEVKLGILPGAGGTQRLPRLIGVEPALAMITDGNDIPAAKAKAIGLVDEIIEGDLLAGAIAFTEKLLDEGRPIRRVGEMTAKVENPAIFNETKAALAKKQRGFLAPQACVDAVKLSTEYPIEEGSKREYALCRELMVGNQSKAQRHAFFAEREVAKVPDLPEGTSVREIKTVGVAGPGAMGTGIAMCCIAAGLPVVLVGMDQPTLEKSQATMRKIYGGNVAKGTMTQEALDARMALITPTTDYADLKDVDLVIEAVFEDMAVKKEVFATLGKVTKAGAILASNTSYLDIDQLAEASGRPGDVAGMHFFNPANVMRLLENVRGAKTSPDVIATIMKFGKTIKKVSVLSGVCDGFIGNRMLAKRSREGMFLLEEGATPWQIDKVLYDFGFAMGPYQVADLAGIDIQHAARKARWDKLSEREHQANVVDQLFALGRLGQKSGKGYYVYDDKRKSTPDPEVEALIVKHSAARGITRRPVSDEEIRERLIYVMINEGAKILEEGIAARPTDIDIVWLTGFGFPTYLGGPMFYADTIGLKTVYDALKKYQASVGDEFFKPAPLLERLALEGKGFYSK
ncbi:MAG TPA: 3-hydroxyacyl-CoA dehydrogenase NAD-binding domain-containing protein [Alphaproteobacteria bacterium]|nr:3-hydroxyacyl-CoA dehydrogenase NAD-binding domain-containing protein [Alphaproteobacteria bacterium]